MTQLSKNFSLAEMTRSYIASKNGIDNTAPPDIVVNLADFARRLELIRITIARPMIITSGYRCPELNMIARGRSKSAHMEGRAAHIADDRERTLARFCLANANLLRTAGLWLENPEATPGWIHLQSRPAAARVFNP